MSENNAPSQAYRNQLANELAALRKNGDSTTATQLLEQHKQTHIYQLAKVLHQEKPTFSPFNQRKFDEEIIEASQSHATVSNEPSLFETFPYIKHVSGAGLGVGFDQMFDIAVNTQLTEIFVVDVLPEVSLATKTVLEVGRRHHELFGSYPTVEQFLAYFQERNLHLTLEAISHQFTAEELAHIKNILTATVKEKKTDQPIADAPLQIEYYLRFKSQQPDYASWLSTPENLHKILQMYERGQLTPILGDVTGEKTMPAIAAKLTAQNIPLSLVYLSNAKYYIGKFRRTDELQKNLAAMPIADATVMVSSKFSNTPLPESVTQDQWMSRMMLSWDYEVQTVVDIEQQRAGAYKVTSNGKEYKLSDLADRAYAIEEGYTTETEMNLQMPKQGVYIAGLPSQPVTTL